MLKAQTIGVPIFNQGIRLISGDKHEVVDYLNDLYHENIDYEFIDGARACTGRFDADIWVYIDTGDISVSILSYELIHAVYDLFHVIGLDLSDQEAFAYMHQYLLEETLPYIVRKIEYGYE